jgi:hypothetical protein
MARATLTPINPGRNGSATVTPVANVVVDGQQVAAGDIDGLILIFANASGGAAVVTIKAGTAFNAWMKSYGDLTVAVPNGQSRVVGPLESARFENGDGMVYINSDVVVSTTAIQVP